MANIRNKNWKNKLSERFISKTLHIRVNTPNIKEILVIKKKNPNYQQHEKTSYFTKLEKYKLAPQDGFFNP